MERGDLLPYKKPRLAILALHGWTGNALSMEPISKSFNYPNTKWVLPQAPYFAKETSQNRKEDPVIGYSWSESTLRGRDYPKSRSLEKSMIMISQCIHDLENEGFDKKNIFILGFSQGAIFSIWFTINQKFSLGGCISIAGGFKKEKLRISKSITQESRGTSILLMHGQNDKIIPPEESQNTYQIFDSLGFNVELILYQAAHKIPIKAKELIWNFLTSRNQKPT